MFRGKWYDNILICKQNACGRLHDLHFNSDKFLVKYLWGPLNYFPPSLYWSSNIVPWHLFALWYGFLADGTPAAAPPPPLFSPLTPMAGVFVRACVKKIPMSWTCAPRRAQKPTTRGWGGGRDETKTPTAEVEDHLVVVRSDIDVTDITDVEGVRLAISQ